MHLVGGGSGECLGFWFGWLFGVFFFHLVSFVCLWFGVFFSFKKSFLTSLFVVQSPSLHYFKVFHRKTVTYSQIIQLRIPSFFPTKILHGGQEGWEGAEGPSVLYTSVSLYISVHNTEFY